MPGTLVLLCGLPGAGKTTLARRMEAEREAIRLSPDDWIAAVLADPLDVKERDRLRNPVENLQWELAQTWLRQGRIVVLDNGFWTEEERTAYSVVAIELGARIELYFLDVPHEELWRRIAARNAAHPTSAFVMSRAEVEGYAPLFEAPTAEELAFYDVGDILQTRPLEP